MNQRDAEDMIQAQTTLLTTIAIKLEDSIIIFATRRLPDYVCLDPSLRMDAASTDNTYKDELLYTISFTTIRNSEYRIGIQINHRTSTN